MNVGSNLRTSMAGSLALNQRGRMVAPMLADELSRLNYEIVDDGPAELLIHLNYNWKSMREISNFNLETFKVLIRLEPPCVYPVQYTQEVVGLYDLVLSPGRPAVSQKSFIPWPYQFQENPSKPVLETPKLLTVVRQRALENRFDYNNWKSRKIFCSMIAANKVSPNGTGNYDLRRAFAKYCTDSKLKIFGGFWQSNLADKLRYRLGVLSFAIASGSEFSIRAIFKDINSKYSYVNGDVDDKHIILLNSKFSLVVENSDDYVSEKLLDCLVNGCIPVYFGTELIGTNLREELVIRAEVNPDNLLDFLDSLDPELIERKLLAIHEFVLSSEFLEWEASNVFKLIAEKIDHAR